MSIRPDQKIWRRLHRRAARPRISAATIKREGVLLVGQVYSFVYVLNEHRVVLMHVHELEKPGGNTTSMPNGGRP